MHPLALIDSRTVTDSFRPAQRASVHNDEPGSVARAATPRRRTTRRVSLARFAGRAAAALASLR